MKKTLCFILALSMYISAFSCSSKKKDSKPKPDITEEEITPEKPFVTLGENDFKTINVTLTESDDKAPITFDCIETYNLDFGSRVAACAKEGHYEDFHSLNNGKIWMQYDSFDEVDQSLPYGTFSSEDGSEYYTQQVPDFYTDSVYEEQQGNIENFAVYGDTAYLTVNFEPASLSNDSHEWAVFRYDIPTETLTEIYTFSSTDSICIDFCYAGGKFWYTELGGEYALYALDLDSCEYEKVYSSDVSFDISGENEPVIYQYGEGSEYEIFMINPETYEITPFLSDNSFSQSKYVSASGITAYLEKNEESHRFSIVSDYYNIETGIRSGTLIYADENTFTIQQGDTLLHFFDIEKKEHYVLEFSEYGSTDFAYCDGGIIINSFGSYISKDGLYYAIPQLGLVFRLADYEYFYATDSDAAENFVFDENGVVYRVDNYGFFKNCTDYFAFADFYNDTVQISEGNCSEIRRIGRIFYKTF